MPQHNKFLPTTLPRIRPVAPEMIHYPYEEESASVELPTDHLHWGITAFSKIEEGDRLADTTTIEVEAPDEGTAIVRAQRILQRPYYRVAWVRQTCSLDPTLKEAK